MKKKFLSVLAVSAAALISFSGCGLFPALNDQAEDITVYMPDGAPALALAKLMKDDTKEDGVSYFVVDAKTIASKVNFGDADKNADICVMPVTAASKLPAVQSNYKMVGLATQGNLYLMAKTEQAEITADTLQSLIGKTILVSQINEVPGLTLKATLSNAGLAWQELKEDVEKSDTAVNLVAVSDTFDYEVVAEPAVSKRLSMNKNWQVVGDMQALYDSENRAFPQAAIVVKNSLLAENESFVKDFLKDVALAGAWLIEENATEIYSAVSSHLEDKDYTSVFTAEALKADTLSRCGVRFELAKDCKEKTLTYLSGLLAVDEKAVKIPAAEFFYSSALD